MKNFEKNLKNTEEKENFELKKEEELLEKNLNESKEMLDSIGGAEGLEKKVDEIGEEKVKQILSRTERYYQKTIIAIKDAIKLSALPILTAGAVYGGGILNNMSNIETVNPTALAIGTGLFVTAIEIGVILSSRKEKRREEARSSIED